MDSRLDTLSLPILKPSIHAPDVELGERSDPPYHVGFLADCYFEWVGTFESSMFTRGASNRFTFTRSSVLSLSSGNADTYTAFKRNGAG